MNNYYTMSLLSVPLTPELEKNINWLVDRGIAKNKADAARKAIEFFVEEQAVRDVLQAEKELKDGKVLRGNLDELAKKL